MAVIKLSDEYKAILRDSFVEDKSKEKTADIFKTRSELESLIKTIQTLLKEDEYILVKGIDNNSPYFFSALISQFGGIYGEIEYTGIKIKCDYTGCNRNKLVLHNDDAIDLNNQPKFGFIKIVKEDPVLEVENGIVLIKEVVNLLKWKDYSLLSQLLNTPVPMLSYGVNYSAKGKVEITVNEPIIYTVNGEYRVRFDDSRIAHYYYRNKKMQSSKELEMIESFLSYCDFVKHKLVLEEGDLLIHNNLTTLHDRSECSIEIRPDGSVNTREIMVGFAR